MKTLSSLLERVSKSLGRSTIFKETVISIIKEKTGATVDEKNIFFKEGVLEIIASPALKNELRIREDAIKSALRDRTGMNVSRILYR